MFVQFKSPNLRHRDGKIYYLNKDEIKDNKLEYTIENYYYNIEDIKLKFDDYTIELIVNDYNDDILVKCIFNEESEQSDKLNELFTKINKDICELGDHGEKYNIDVSK